MEPGSPFSLSSVSAALLVPPVRRAADSWGSCERAEMNLTQLSQRCLTSFFSSQAQMADLELRLSNQTDEETNNFLNIIYGQFPSVCKRETFRFVQS